MTEPMLLLLDEPSSGLDRARDRGLAEHVARRSRRERGTAILLVEHDVEFVRSFASRLYVLDFGTLIASGPTAEVLADDAVRKAYLGSWCDAPLHRAVARVAAPLLELRDVDAGYGPFRALFGVSLSRSPEARCSRCSARTAPARPRSPASCSGLSRRRRARCSSTASTITGRAVPDRPARASSHAPEGRSVFASLTVEENLVARRSGAARSAAACAAALDRAYELFPRLGERRKQVAGTLSGGEQRMLSLARCWSNPPRLLVADELSLGPGADRGRRGLPRRSPRSVTPAPRS